MYETLAGACGVSFFVWVQHHAPVRLLLSARGGDDPTLVRLRSGEMLGGIAFAYLRRAGPPAVVARPAAGGSSGGGLVVDGEAPWVTSWGLADTYAVAARLGADPDGGDVVFFLLDGASPPPGVEASGRLALAAMNASSTVRLRFDGLVVPEEDVISVQPFETWRAADRVATAKPHPAVLGVARTCCRLLGDAGRRLDEERLECRRQAYALLDEGRTDEEHLARLTEARAWSCELAVRAATALVVAGGGRSMLVTDPAQRLLRESAFFTIQAQSAELRTATLARLHSTVQKRRI
ncbi:MAG TPA: hypothetical protein VM942_04350 [Acidimicrobiales bacterium]|nr:hypothetical protein [Acidimicrobiales bacterium]